MRRVGVLVAVVSLLSMAVGVSEAAAHKRKLPRITTVEFLDLPGSSGDRVSGVVSIGQKPADPIDGGGEPLAHTSSLPAQCIANQKVLIKHTLTAEGGGSAQPTVVATAITDASGAWQSTSYEASGANQLLFDSFQIEVVKSRVPPKNGQHKHVCLGAFGNKTVFSY